MDFFSNTAPGALIANRINRNAFFGGLGVSLLPWQQVAMDQRAILGAQAGVYGRSIAEEIMARGRAMQNDMERVYLQAMQQREARRYKAPWAYWQFKNGKIAVVNGPSDLPYDNWDCSWDRSLGTYVCYASR